MTANVRVLIRADAGMSLGFGHVMRCLALAQALVARGATVIIAARVSDSAVESRVTAIGAQLFVIGEVSADEVADGPVWSAARQHADAELLTQHFAEHVDAIVVDHYQLDQCWESVWKQHGKHVVVIDDLANRPHVGDVIVDHNWYGAHTARRYEKLVPSTSDLLLGPRYALLQPDYVELRVQGRVPHATMTNVLVNFGGTDVTGQSAHAVTALMRYPEINVDVVIGTAAAMSPELSDAIERHGRARLHIAVPSLAPFLAKASVAIGAGGTSTWERLCLGVPSLVTTVSPNQSGVTRQFDADGLVRWLGTAKGVNEETYAQALAECIDHGLPELPAIVDGHGAGRVALAVLAEDSEPLTARPATPIDTAAFVTAGAAGVDDGGGSQVWRERTAWFNSRGLSQNVVRILELGSVPVGAVVAGQRAQVDPYVKEPMALKESQ